MVATFSITTDAAAKLVRITLAGFFAEEDVRRFVAARDAAHARLPGPLGDHLTLVDIRDMKIQPQSTVSAFADVLGDSGTQSRRIAFVVSGGLARAQLMRASGGRGQLFPTPEAAEAWLLSS
jgi:hypothetical protein